MSSSKRLIINCGTSQVTAAEVSLHAHDLQLDRLVTEPLDYDFSNDDAWLLALGDALKVLSKSHKFGGKATFILPGCQVLTKPIRIPHVEEVKRAQTIAFEAQQSIPYPLHEVVWDYEVVGDDGVEIEVLFVACKVDVVNQLCQAISSAGFVAEKIDAATLLDNSALEFAYGSDEDSLLINVGARSTNLLFKSADSYFVRNITLGGNTLTQSIADSIGKGFTQAEVLKTKFFSSSEVSATDSGAQALVSSAESFTRRMNQEITRSIVNYRRQKQAKAPSRIWLNGRGAQLNGLVEQLAASQKVPVEFFDPLQSVTLDGGIMEDPSELRLYVSEIIGEASLQLTGGTGGVNLLPADVQSEMAFSAKKPFLAVAAICFALAPWPVFMSFSGAANAYKEEARAIENQAAPLSSRSAQIVENTEKIAAVSQSIQRIEGLMNSKTNWIQFFAGMQDILFKAQDVWMDDLEVIRDQAEGGELKYEVAIAGQMLVRETSGGRQAIDQEAITARIKLIQASLESSQFVVGSKPLAIDWAPIRNGLNVLPFRINLVVDTAKPL